MLSRKKRVLVHLKEDGLPSAEGLLVSRRHREYVLAVPQLHTTPDASPAVLTSRLLVIPREQVAFYEVID